MFDFTFVSGDDEFAYPFVSDAVLGAEVIKEMAPADAESVFKRAGQVIDAGMNDTAVPAAGLLSKYLILFQHVDGAVLAGDR